MTALMDFAMVPPEVNSGLMYAGPGSAPTLAVAAAWNGLAAELRSTADSFGAVVGNLSGEWEGPSAQAMAAAAQPQLVWMTTAAAQAEQTAAQATAWAGAYDTAFAMTVPPPVIAANRALLASLIATNVFGQNTGAIMATEAQYEQMWAQDAAAMYGYAGSAAAAATLTPFAAPGSTADPAAASTQMTASQLMSSVPTALQDLAAPAASTSGSGSTTTGLAGLVDSIFGSNSPLGEVLNSQFANTASSFGENGITAFANTGSFFASLGQMAQSAGGAASAAGGAASAAGDAAGAAAGAAGAAGQAATGGLGSLGAVSAGLGRGTSLGQLSVPPTWAVNPAATPFQPPLGLTPLKTPNAYAEGMPGMPLPGSTPMRAPGRPEPDYGIRRLRFMARPVAAG